MMRPSYSGWDATRTFSAAIVLLSAFALGVTGVSVGHALTARNVAQQRDLSLPAPNSDRDLFTPVEDRIRAQEAYVKQLKDPVIVAEENRKLAKLYSSFGDRSESLGRFSQAEMAFQRSAALDPENGARDARLAQLYYVSASAKTDPEWQIRLYRSSAEQYIKAAEDIPGYRGSVAEAYRRLGETYERAGDADLAAAAFTKAGAYSKAP
jgi:tetratricopeptide (TPR) repeat protein